jgi:hypothetical protein
MDRSSQLGDIYFKVVCEGWVDVEKVLVVSLFPLDPHVTVKGITGIQLILEGIVIIRIYDLPCFQNGI